jgi:outer membrane protein insertion porin family
MQDAILIVFMSIGLLWIYPHQAVAETNVSQEAKAYQPDEPLGRRNVVKSIEFVGNKEYKDKVLLQRLDFKTGDLLDYILIEAGRKTLTEIHQKIGFAFVRVTFDKEKLSEGNVVYTIKEGPRVRIGKVSFSGNASVKTGLLKKAIKTKQKKWFYWPFYYTQEMVTEDIERLENFYYKRGFLDYKITAKTEFSDDNSEAYITFLIVEGPTYKVRLIVFTGNKFFDDSTLEAKLELKSGQVYIKPRAEKDTERLAQLYREFGFVDVEVNQRPKFVPDDNMVDVEVEIIEGGQFRIGLIEITGNEFTQDKVIRRILDEYDFAPGQLYNAGIAPKQGSGKLEKKIQRMVLADEVIISPVSPASGDNDQRDVNVDIKEGLTGMLGPGIFISSDTGLSGRFTFDQRNFDIADWPESLKEFITMNAFKGAGQSLRISLSPGTEYSSYLVDFSDPYWQDRPTTFNMRGSKYIWFRESYDEDRLESFIAFEKRLKGDWRKLLAFRVENVDVSNLDSDAPKEIRAVKGDNALIGGKVGIGRDMRDDEFEPSQGYIFNVNYEQVTGDFTFGIPEAKYVWYKTLYEDLLERKTVLATKLQAKTTLGDAPPFEKFYAGGSSTLRGFEYRGVSTRGLPSKDPIGSDWIFLANTELLVPLIGKNISALFFVDSGAIETGPYRMAAGGGIQIMIPWFGQVPMRFELAAPIKKDDDDETQAFSFSIGGRLF